MTMASCVCLVAGDLSAACPSLRRCAAIGYSRKCSILGARSIVCSRSRKEEAREKLWAVLSDLESRRGVLRALDAADLARLGQGCIALFRASAWGRTGLPNSAVAPPQRTRGGGSAGAATSELGTRLDLSSHRAGAGSHAAGARARRLGPKVVPPRA